MTPPLGDHREYLSNPDAIRKNVLKSLRRGEMKDDILEDHASLVAWCNTDYAIAPGGAFLQPDRISFPVVEDIIQDLALRYAVGEVK